MDVNLWSPATDSHALVIHLGRDAMPELATSSLAILIILVAFFQLVPYEKGGEVILSPIDFFAGFEKAGVPD